MVMLKTARKLIKPVTSGSFPWLSFLTQSCLPSCWTNHYSVSCRPISTGRDYLRFGNGDVLKDPEILTPYLGYWHEILEERKGSDEYLRVQGVEEKNFGKYQHSRGINIMRDDDIFRIEYMHHGRDTVIHVFQLNLPFRCLNRYGMMHIKYFIIPPDRLACHQIYTRKPLVYDFKFQVNGNEMELVTECNGAVMTTKFLKATPPIVEERGVAIGI